MTRIRMMETITGGRYDGRPWPAIHETIHVPEWEAMELVRAKHAVYEEDPTLAEPPAESVGSPGPEAVTVTAPPSVTGPDTPAPGEAQDGDGEEPASDLTGVSSEQDGNGDDVARPAVNQPKAAWVAWAVKQGADPAAAEAMTKADLMSEYGSRL